MGENRAKNTFVKDHNTVDKEKILQVSREEKSSPIQRNGMALDFATATLDARRSQCNVFKMLVESNQQLYTQPNIQASKCEGKALIFLDMPQYLWHK